MIHGASNDPVLIKKISLRIWTLRDEVEARIKENLYLVQDLGDETGPAPDKLENSLSKLGQEYLNGGVLTTDNSAEKKATAAETVVPEAATTENENQETAQVETPTGEENEEGVTAEAAMPENATAEEEVQEDEYVEPPLPELLGITNTPDGKVIISQKRPQLKEEMLNNGKTLLSEVYMDKMFFFCGKKFFEGQSIVIEFMIPKRFLLNADVIYCRPYSLKTRIISSNKLPYRIAVRFTFLKPGERTLLRQFLEAVEPDLTKQKPKDLKSIKQGPTESSDDEFSELDGLDI